MHEMWKGHPANHNSLHTVRTWALLRYMVDYTGACGLCRLCWLRLLTPISFIYTWRTITNQVAHSDTDNQCDRPSACGCTVWQWCALTICGLMRMQYFAIRTTASDGAYTTPPGEYYCNFNKLQIVSFTMLDIYEKNNVYYITTTVYLLLSFVITISQLSVPAHM